MAVSTLQSIPAHPRANAYVGLTEADQYFADRNNSTSWTGATSDQKTQAIIEATRLIDSFRFHHERLKTWQRLEFPRNNVDIFSGGVDSATNSVNGTIVDADLANKITMFDDYWNYAGLWFFGEGDGNFQKFHLVTDFNAANGTLTISGTFSVLPVAGEQYQLIAEIPPEIKWATLETALTVIDGDLDQGNATNIKRQKLGDEEVEYFDQSTQTINLPLRALELIKPYVSTVGRYNHQRMFR